MGSAVPKQFLHVGDKTIIEWTVLALAGNERIDGLYIGLSGNADRSQWINAIHAKIDGVFAGAQMRAGTVLNGLQHMLGQGCSADDWVLIHDANRPLLLQNDITQLIETVGDDENGGILSLPVHDTLKLGESGAICKTLDREDCFRALTPQMFKLGLLRDALSHAIENNLEITDESQAMEQAGFRPNLVVGSATNIKITTPSDLKFAEAIMTSGSATSGSGERSAEGFE